MLSGAESRESADGQRHAACRFNLPASQASNFHIHTSIIQRACIVGVLACHSGRRQTWVRRGGGERGGQGGEGGLGKKETDEMDGETAACVKEDTREEEGKGKKKKKRPGETRVYRFAGETL